MKNDPNEISNMDSPLVKAQELFDQAEADASGGDLNKAAINFHFAAKYARIAKDYSLCALAYFREMQIAVVSQDPSNIGPLYNLALENAQRSNSEGLIRQLKIFLSMHPPIKDSIEKWNQNLNEIFQPTSILNEKSQMKFNIFKQKHSFSKKNIKINLSNKPVQEIPLISINNLKEEYEFVRMQLCPHCQRAVSLQKTGQALLFGMIEQMLKPVDVLSFECSHCHQISEFYFDIDAFFWQGKTQAEIPKEKEKLAETFHLEENQFINVGGLHYHRD